MNIDSLLYQVAKPARYTGGEWNSITKDWDKTKLKIALIYPDLYDLGMSNMAIPILYELFNSQPDVLAERAYAPWKDMETQMRSAAMPLYGLESKRPLREFDVIGFSLGYELCYTNVLNMLDLARIPVLASERDDSFPLVIAGGSSVLNPEPMADFIDFFVIGEGEEVCLELLNILREGKSPKTEVLRKVATIPGVYVPSLYRPEYQPDGTLKSLTPTVAEASPVIKRRIVDRLPPPPTRMVVPYIETVHDRGAIEIQRGCSRGCRFCQASMIYRPVRERPHEEVLKAAGDIIANCGYDEVSLVSLSTSDYQGIDRLVGSLTNRYPDLRVSLPSLRIDCSSVTLVDSLPSQRKTGLTFAPEAGSERLRYIINKCIPENILLETAAIAFDRGWTTLKLYFMLGLPYETMEDVQYIAKLIGKVYDTGKGIVGNRIHLGISVSTFVPKPHTPFQWVAQEKEEQVNAKHELLKSSLRKGGLKLSWQDPKVSLLEAALSRGDRRVGKAILRAWQLGSTFDAWSEHFKFDNWQRAFSESGLDIVFYAQRERPLDELLPWSHIDIGVSTVFLKREYQRALEGKETPDCRYKGCVACGFESWHPLCKRE